MPREQRVIGRYCLYDSIAQGGMATVHLGRLLGSAGFTRTVAIKRLHAQYARDPEFVSMFLDEARLAARIRHPNVVPTLDVVARDGELFLVMDYVHGETLARVLGSLRERGELAPIPIVCSILVGVLHGLHAAHEATSEGGGALGIIHRDISPQNVLIGTDGIARVVDFGVAKAAGRLQTTRGGGVKGKLAYMAPEQLMGSPVTRQVDVFGAGVVLWEALTGKRLFRGANEGETVSRVLNQAIEPPSRHGKDVTEDLDAVVLGALEREPARRWKTAREMASALERSGRLAPPSEVGEWLAQLCSEALEQRAGQLDAVETSSIRPPAHSSMPPPAEPDPGARATAPPESASPPGLISMDRPGGEATVSAFGAQKGLSRVRLSWSVGALLGAVLIATAIGLALAGRAGRGGEARSSEEREPRAAAAPQSPPATTAPPTPPASATAPPAASATVSTAPAASTTRPASQGKPGAAGRARAAAPPAACAQPYYVDAQGVRRVRRECFR